MTAAAFWKNGSFDERVLQEISGTCVHTKSRGIEATCIVGGDRGRPCVSSHSQCKQHELGGGQRTRLCIVICTCVFPNTVDNGTKPKDL